MSIKSLVMVCAALVVGFASGVYLSRPPKVKAAIGYIYLQKVHEGNNMTPAMSGEPIGFSCTQQDCYIASR
jgi:hypothetical protein